MGKSAGISFLLILSTILFGGCAELLSKNQRSYVLPDFTVPYQEAREVVVRIIAVSKADPKKPNEELKALTGSGVILFSKSVLDAYESLIVTNLHVLEEAEEVKVLTSGGTMFRAQIFSWDKPHDLALLKIRTPHKLTTARLGDSSTLKIGQWVLAVGNLFSFKWSLSIGVVSNLRQDPWFDVIHFDGSFHPGNSGGGLFNLRTELIGIPTLFYRGELVKIGVAISVDLLKKMLPALLEGGEVTHGQDQLD